MNHRRPRLHPAALPLLFALLTPPARAADAPPAATSPPAKSDWTIRGHLTADQFVIQSHRGAGDLAPENTLEAFDLGWKLGTYPECDVRTTRDGVIVTFHDNDFSRVVKGADAALKKKGVADLTWDELSKLDVGAYKGDQFQGHHVIKVAQAFERLAAHPNRRLYMDIKNVDLPQLATEVKQHKVERQVILASTNYKVIREWKRLVPESGTLHWMGGTEEQLRKRFEDLRKTKFADITQLQIHVRLKPNVDVTGPDPFNLPDAFLIEAGRELRAHDVTFQSLPWGATDPKVYRKLLDLGVMSFATDRPDVTLDAVRTYLAADKPTTTTP